MKLINLFFAAALLAQPAVAADQPRRSITECEGITIYAQLRDGFDRYSAEGTQLAHNVKKVDLAYLDATLAHWMSSTSDDTFFSLMIHLETPNEDGTYRAELITDSFQGRITCTKVH